MDSDPDHDDTWRSIVARLVTLAGVSEAPSQWADRAALWVDGREIAHLGSDGWLDVRLSRKLIAQHRAALRSDPAVELRRSGGDWARFRVETDEALAEAVRFCGLAVEANRRPRR